MTAPLRCADCQPLLTGYHHGEADAAERERIAAHLAACQDCAAVYRDMQRHLAALDRAPVPRPNPGRLEKITREIRLGPAADSGDPLAPLSHPRAGMDVPALPSAWRKFLLMALIVAALLATVTALAIWFRPPPREQAKHIDAAIPPSILVAGSHNALSNEFRLGDRLMSKAETRVRLQDGAILTVANDSVLVWKATRLFVLEKGAVRVEAPPGITVAVDCDGVVAEAASAEFWIRPDAMQAVLTVTQGNAKFYNDRGFVEVSAGQQASGGAGLKLAAPYEIDLKVIVDGARAGPADWRLSLDIVGQFSPRDLLPVDLTIVNRSSRLLRIPKLSVAPENLILEIRDAEGATWQVGYKGWEVQEGGAAQGQGRNLLFRSQDEYTARVKFTDIVDKPGVYTVKAVYQNLTADVSSIWTGRMESESIEVVIR